MHSPALGAAIADAPRITARRAATGSSADGCTGHWDAKDKTGGDQTVEGCVGDKARPKRPCGNLPERVSAMQERRESLEREYTIIKR
jgi:hypothetical protein